MKIGERIIEGQIKERGEAKKVYEQAKQDGKRTSLVEQSNGQTSLRPLRPISVRANESPSKSNTRKRSDTRMDGFSSGFPWPSARRYIPGTPVIIENQAPKGWGTSLDTDRVPDASRITPPVKVPSQGSINPVSLSVTLNPGFPVAKVESPFHPIIVDPGRRGGYQITLGQRPSCGSRFQLDVAPDAPHRTDRHSLHRTSTTARPMQC